MITRAGGERREMHSKQVQEQDILSPGSLPRMELAINRPSQKAVVPPPCRAGRCLRARAPKHHWQGAVLVGPISHSLLTPQVAAALSILLCLSFLSEVDKYSVYHRQHCSLVARRPITVPSDLLLPLLFLEPDDRRGRNHPFVSMNKRTLLGDTLYCTHQHTYVHSVHIDLTWLARHVTGTSLGPAPCSHPFV